MKLALKAMLAFWFIAIVGCQATPQSNSVTPTPISAVESDWCKLPFATRTAIHDANKLAAQIAVSAALATSAPVAVPLATGAISAIPPLIICHGDPGYTGTVK